MTDPTEAIRKAHAAFAALPSATTLSALHLVCKPSALGALLDRLDSAERDQRRYQWLRDQDNEDFTFAVIKNPHFDVYESPEELDAAIDAALRVGAAGGEG